ncbi:hypothetical protein TNCV_4761161 [Trichonephila clavipes]|uniref:Uncharacterized protein n=1 Tax=Trichonephila clavipes TaxID=2585209 RepID=A0A8X6RQB1_TRICX|nr:hypothetical protein TNCV_4761161 [Trichonephila clavipes]
MNSPDCNDYIDMFNVPTPMASPSYEVMYDSLPPMEESSVSDSSLEDPMEQSKVLESPLKEPVHSKPPVVSKSPDPPVKKVNSVIRHSPRSKELRNEERWINEETRNEEQLKEGQNKELHNEERRNVKR